MFPIPQKMAELVVARYKEDLSWLASVPEAVAITVYNKGPRLRDLPARTAVVSLPNVGRESHTFATHCQRRHDSMADYTLFTQGDPFPHSPLFLHFTTAKGLRSLRPYNTLSLKYLGDLPPAQLLGDEKLCRSEEFNLFTMNATKFHDAGTVEFYKGYLRHHRLPPGNSIMHHFFCSIGLPDRVPKDALVGRFPYGALFGVSKERVLQHEPAVYERIAARSTEHPSVGYIIERSWALLFDDPDASLPGLP